MQSFAQPITFNQFVESLLSDEFANWSQLGATMLWNWYNDHEMTVPGWTDDNDTFCFDRVAMRCAWTEYNDINDAVVDAGIKLHDNPSFNDKVDALQSLTTVLANDMFNICIMAEY